MIRYFIFDFGRVIVDFAELEMTEKFVTDKRHIARAHRVIFDRLYWDRLDLGTISDREVKLGIMRRLGGQLGTEACLVYDNWVRTLTLIPHIEEAIAAAKKKGEGLYLLSNISEKFARDYPAVPHVAAALAPFDGMVFSGVVHLVKPDRRIYEHLLSTYGLTPDECLFIDDSPKNIAGAAALGINTYLFDGDALKLKAYIEAL